MISRAELLALMHAAPVRLGSLRGAVRTWHHPKRYEAACPTQSRPRRHKPSGPRAEPLELRHRLWVAGPDRFRLESDLPGPGGTAVLVGNGAHWWWHRRDDFVLADDDGRPVFYANDLRYDLLIATFVGWLDYDVLTSADHVGRRCWVVRARPREVTAAQVVPPLLVGDEREMLVDQEKGIVLRFENRLGAQPFYCFEFEEVAFDEDLAEELFPPRPPTDEPVQSYAEHLADAFLPLSEAAARTSFAVLVPESLHAVTCPSVVYGPGRGSCPEHVILMYSLPGAALIQLLESPEGHFGQCVDERWERVEQEGDVVYIDGAEERDMLTTVHVRRHGTEVRIAATLPREAMLALARSLRPLAAQSSQSPRQGDLAT